jgi:lipopolysaccharide transport system permease protein
VFALAGMTMWLLFSGSLMRTADSTLSSVALISKVYFPRVIIPLSAVLAPVVDFAVAFVVLLIALAIYGVELQVNLLLTPVMLLLALVVALGAGLWLSALAVRYRDVQQLVPFTIQVLLFATPVLYPLSQVPDHVQWVYALNPLVGVMEGFRWATLPGADAPGWMLVIPAVTGTLMLVSGLLYFQRAEQDFADVI